MYEVVEFYDGGYVEKVLVTCATEEEARAYCEEHEIYLGTDNYGEDGVFIRTLEGVEIWE